AVFLRRFSRPALVHQRAKASEPLEDCQPLDTRLHLVNENNSKYQNNGGRRRGAASTRWLCHHQQSFWLSRWDHSWKPFPGHFCFKTGSKKLAGGWSVDDAL